VVFADAEAAENPAQLADYIGRHHIGMLSLTPSRLQAYLRHPAFCQAVSRLEIHGIARTEAERFLGHGNESVQRQPRAGHPVQSHHGGGYLGKTGHGPFFFCVGTEKKLAGIGLNGNVTGPLLCLGGKLEYTGQGQKE